MPRGDYIEVISSRLRERRLEMGLKAVDVAKHCGISKSSLSDLEHGRRNSVSPQVRDALEEILKLPSGSLEAAKAEMAFEETLKRVAIDGDQLQFDLDDLGLDLGALTLLIERSPRRAFALTQTLRQMALGVGITQEQILEEWLRARAEIDPDYWRGLEDSAKLHMERHEVRSLSPGARIDALLKAHGVQVRPLKWKGSRPTVMGKPLDSILVERPGQTLLYLAPDLSPGDQLWLKAREAAQQLQESPHRSHTWPHPPPASYKERRSNYEVGYLALCLLLEEDAAWAPLERALKHTGWREGLNALCELLQAELEPGLRLRPELIVNRWVALVRHHLGIEPVFLEMRGRPPHDHEPPWLDRDGEPHKDADRHLIFTTGARYIPIKSVLRHFNPFDWYCRRWLTTRMMISKPEDRARGEEGEKENGALRVDERTWVHMQKSEFYGLNMDRVLNICVLMDPAHPPRRGEAPGGEGGPGSQEQQVLTLSLSYEGTGLDQKVPFSFDPALPWKDVGFSCETCSIFDRCDDAVRPLLRREDKPDPLEQRRALEVFRRRLALELDHE